MMDSVSLRGFQGGWNVVDDDLSMAPKYLVTQKNMHRTPSGGSELRFGQEWFADIKDCVNGDIIDCWYFTNHLIVVTDEGEVGKVDNSGMCEAIWNTAIAGALPGSPAGWGTAFMSVNFVPFKSQLAIHNGVDKPLVIDSDLAVDYLQDEGTGSNTNTPIGKYGCTVANYHCVAGIDGYPTVVYISSKGTIGTFPLDTAPNDAISIDVGAYAPAGATEIRGIAGFTKYLLVFFLSQTLILELGTYDTDGNHTPLPNDTLPHVGLLGHRNIIQADKDLLFADFDGVNTAKRNLFTGNTITNDHESDIIGPAWQAEWSSVDQDDALVNTFAVYDRLGNRILFFTPSGHIYVYTYNQKLRLQAWSLYEFSEPFTSACTSFLGRVFLTKGTRVYKQGNKAFGETFYADYLSDRDSDWLNATAYTVGDLILDTDLDTVYECLVSHTSPATGTFADQRTSEPTFWIEYTGREIDFEMELPWLDGKEPMTVKQSRFIQIGSLGDAQFTFEAYVDNLYKDVDGNVIYDPGLSIDFVGNQEGGFGADPDQPFGGGRRSGDPRLFNAPVKFKTLKPRIYGSSKNHALQITSMTFLFAKGSFKR
jgi:hypothetical protein